MVLFKKTKLVLFLKLFSGQPPLCFFVLFGMYSKLSMSTKLAFLLHCMGSHKKAAGKGLLDLCHIQTSRTGTWQ